MTCWLKFDGRWRGGHQIDRLHGGLWSPLKRGVCFGEGVSCWSCCGGGVRDSGKV